MNTKQLKQLYEFNENNKGASKHVQNQTNVKIFIIYSLYWNTTTCKITQQKHTPTE